MTGRTSADLFVNGSVRDLFALTPADVDSWTIAKALSHMTRFVGHTRYAYSIAQHAVLVSYLCPAEFAYEGLHHDDTEAFTGDIATPIKRRLVVVLSDGPGGEVMTFRDYEQELRARVIAPALGLAPVEPPEVKAADMAALALEQRYVQGRNQLDGRDRTVRDGLPVNHRTYRAMLRRMDPEDAAREWYRRHTALLGIRVRGTGTTP